MFLLAPVDAKAQTAAATFRSAPFVQLSDAFDGAELRNILAGLLPGVRSLTERTEVAPAGATPSFQGGAAYGRIDPGKAGSPLETAINCEVRSAFEGSGLSDFIERFWLSGRDLISEIVGRALVFDRCFLLRYEEHDFIAPHGDKQTNGRVLVQLPVTFSTVSMFRAVLDGAWCDFYDADGVVRILGPGVIHEVPPVVRTELRSPPERIVVTMRLQQSE